MVRCWKQKKLNKYIAKYVVPTEQKPQGIMIWAAINGAGQLVVERLPPTVTSKEYQQVLEKHLRFIRPGYIWNTFGL